MTSCKSGVLCQRKLNIESHISIMKIELLNSENEENSYTLGPVTNLSKLWDVYFKEKDVCYPKHCEKFYWKSWIELTLLEQMKTSKYVYHVLASIKSSYFGNSYLSV